MDRSSRPRRARQVDRTSANPVEMNIFANVAPAMPIDEIVLWGDIKPDRLWDMIAAGRIYENAAQMHAVYPELFRTARAATDARARMGDIRARTREAVGRDGAAWSEIAFQPAGQGHHVSRGWCRTRDVDAARADIESRLGDLVYWRAFAFTEGREVVRRAVYEYSTVLRTTSRPAGDLERGVLAEYAKQDDQQRAGVFQTPDG
jgi:hypothetical protein